MMDQLAPDRLAGLFLWGHRPDGHISDVVSNAMVQVREGSRLWCCNVLGELVGESKTRFTYRTPIGRIGFVKRWPSVHLEPCRKCPDYRPQRATTGDAHSAGADRVSAKAKAP